MMSRDDDHLLDERVAQRRDRVADEAGAVVGDDHLDPLGQALLHLGQARLDRVDDVERVLAVAHHHDAAGHLALAVELDQAAPDVGAERDVGHVAHEDRDAAGADPQRDQLEVLLLLDVAAAADDVLVAGDLDDAPADVLVGAADRGDDLADRDAVGQQLVRVEVDLVLLDEAADGADLGHAGHALERVAKVPVL